jgi:hypothetical protein
MKTKYTYAASLALAALAAAVVVAGCKTSGYQQADKTGAGIASFRDEIVKCKQATDSTLTALDQIALAANTNPRPAYENYCKQVANLDSSANRVRKSAQEMKDNGQAYFAQWEQQLSQVKDENIRKMAQDRKAKLQESFDKIKEYTEPLKEQFDPWMQSLKDLQTYLSNDLTVNGIAAAKKPFAAAKSNGAKVQKSMDGLVEELNDLAATLTPANVQPVADTNAPPAK